MAIRRGIRPLPLHFDRRQDDDIEEPESSPDSPSPSSGSFPVSLTTSFNPTASATITETTATSSATSEQTSATRQTIGDDAFSRETWVFQASGVLPTTTAFVQAQPDPRISEAAPPPPPPEDSGAGMIGMSPVDEGMELSPAAQGILATFSILGGLGLIALLWVWFRRRNNSKATNVEEKKARGLGLNLFPSSKKDTTPTSPSSPSLEDLIAEPQSAHVPTYRITRAKDESAGWTAKTYVRGENSARDDKARMTMASSVGETLVDGPPRKSVNPFEDPQLNKSYDMIHNRPRSTTLTDTGDWLKNPFEDPRDERFDPFGTLRDRAKEERKKYLALLRAEKERHERSEKSSEG